MSNGEKIKQSSYEFYMRKRPEGKEGWDIYDEDFGTKAELMLMEAISRKIPGAKIEWATQYEDKYNPKKIPDKTNVDMWLVLPGYEPIGIATTFSGNPQENNQRIEKFKKAKDNRYFITGLKEERKDNEIPAGSYKTILYTGPVDMEVMGEAYNKWMQNGYEGSPLDYADQKKIEDQTRHFYKDLEGALVGDLFAKWMDQHQFIKQRLISDLQKIIA